MLGCVSLRTVVVRVSEGGRTEISRSMINYGGLLMAEIGVCGNLLLLVYILWFIDISSTLGYVEIIR